MKTYISLLLVFVYFITGCTNQYPVPVREKNILAGLEKNTADNGLPVAISPTEAVNQFKSYSEWYLLQAIDLKKSQYVANDVSFYSAIGAIGFGLAEKVLPAAALTVFSTTANIPNERYQWAIQSLNYEKASDTMHCVYRRLIPHAAILDRLPSLDVLNDSIYEIRRTLYKKQSSIELINVDTEKLRNAMEEYSAAQKNRNERHSQGNASETLVKSEAEINADIRAENEKAIKLCIAEIN